MAQSVLHLVGVSVDKKSTIDVYKIIKQPKLRHIVSERGLYHLAITHQSCQVIVTEKCQTLF